MTEYERKKREELKEMQRKDKVTVSFLCAVLVSIAVTAAIWLLLNTR